MLKTIYFIGFIALVSLGIFLIKGNVFQIPQTSPQSDNLYAKLKTFPDQSLIYAMLADQAFQFELVNSADSIAQGLSGRKKIGSDGMLFVFKHPDQHGIWMMDMNFNLDLIWIKQAEVIGLEFNAVKPEEGSSELIIYQPDQPAEMVLEVKAGFIDQYKIKIGDELTLIENAERFSNPNQF